MEERKTPIQSLASLTNPFCVDEAHTLHLLQKLMQFCSVKREKEKRKEKQTSLYDADLRNKEKKK